MKEGKNDGRFDLVCRGGTLGNECAFLILVLKPGRREEPPLWQLTEPGSAPLCVGLFDPNVRIGEYERARVRITGPSASSLTITPKRVRDVLVLKIR